MAAQRGSTTGVDANDPVFLPHDGTDYAYVPANNSGNFVKTVDSAAVSVTGDIDLRIKLAVDDWEQTSINDILSKWDIDGGGGKSFWLYIQSGILGLQTTTDGSTQTGNVCTANINTVATNGQPLWVRVTLDADNGASGRDANFYTSEDGETWTQLGATVTASPAVTLNDSGASVVAGSRNTATSLGTAIRFFAVQMYDGIDGTLVADLDVDRDGVGVSLTTGETWTVERSTSGLKTAVVTRPVMLFDGTDDYLQLPASDTPTFTATSGKHTVVVAFRAHHVPSGWDVLLGNDDSSAGFSFRMFNSTNELEGLVRGASSGGSSERQSFTLGDLVVGALVLDEGLQFVYESTQGMSTSSSYAAVGAIAHTAPKVGAGNSASSESTVEIFDVLSFPGVALTEAELDIISAKLIAGTYA